MARTILYDNGSQFVALFLQRVCKVMHISNSFPTTFHPKTSGQVERSNRALTAMLRSDVEEHPQDRCQYIAALCFSYNMEIHSTTSTTPFERAVRLLIPPLHPHDSQRKCQDATKRRV